MDEGGGRVSNRHGGCLYFRVDGRVYDREGVVMTSGWMGGCMTGKELSLLQGGWEGV